MPELDQAFLDYSADKLKQYASHIQDCLSRLTAGQIWMRGSEADNSVGNLVLHLCGNVRQWIGTGIGGAENIRQRDAEFSARGGVDGAELSARLDATIDEALPIIRAQTAQSLVELTQVQNYEVTKLEVIYHVVEHFSGHTGQIQFATKLLTGQDLGYYKHLSPGSTSDPASPTP
jgi:uncharacterized damage-inducible protein DinB